MKNDKYQYNFTTIYPKMPTPEKNAFIEGASVFARLMDGTVVMGHISMVNDDGTFDVQVHRTFYCFLSPHDISPVHQTTLFSHKL